MAGPKCSRHKTKASPGFGIIDTVSFSGAEGTETNSGWIQVSQREEVEAGKPLPTVVEKGSQGGE